MSQMSEMNQVQDDEIDLFELFETLWDGKWLISAFVAIALLVGGGLSVAERRCVRVKVDLFSGCNPSLL